MLYSEEINAEASAAAGAAARNVILELEEGGGSSGAQRWLCAPEIHDAMNRTHGTAVGRGRGQGSHTAKAIHDIKALEVCYLGDIYLSFSLESRRWRSCGRSTMLWMDEKVSKPQKAVANQLRWW